MGRFTPIIMAIAVSGFCAGTAYADLNDGLDVYYPFNGDADDESGNGNHGMVHGAVLTIDREGKSNSTYHFDGMDDYIEIIDGKGMDFGVGPISISVRIRFWRQTHEFLF